MANNKLFFLSGYIAFTIYFALIIVIFIINPFSNIKKFDSISKDTVLELDLIVNQKIKKSNKITVSSSKPQSKVAKKIVKKSTSISAKKRSNLKALFSNVKTTSRKIIKKKINTVKQSSITSRFKSKFEKQKKNNSTKLSKLIETKSGKESKLKSGESKNAHDKYISKIYDILFQRWIPSVIIDGLSAKVIITIYADGSFNYKFLQYSKNTQFNNELKYFLEQQKDSIFPIPNKNKIDIEVIFTAKG